MGRKPLTHEQFMEKFYVKNKNAENIEILGEYVNNKTKIKVRCKIDGHEWKAIPKHLLNKVGCPKCNESKGEKRVAEYLDSRNIEYKPQYRFDNCRSKNDTYERAFNRFIEGKIRDTIKTIYCKENNIKLIRIPYWDFDNIEKILEKEL